MATKKKTSAATSEAAAGTKPAAATEDPLGYIVIDGKRMGVTTARKKGLI